MPRPLPSLQTFLQRPGLLQDLEAFCQSRGYAGLVAMTVSFNERHEPTRKLAVYSRQEPLRSTVSQGTRVGHLRAVPSCGLPQNLPVLGVLGRSQPHARSPRSCAGRWRRRRRRPCSCSRCRAPRPAWPPTPRATPWPLGRRCCPSCGQHWGAWGLPGAPRRRWCPRPPP